MSVITSKSTMLSILKIPSGQSRSSTQRVRFQMPNNIKKIFMEFISSCNDRAYGNLITTLKETEISDNELLDLLTEARNCTSLLNYDFRLFVQAVILFKWTNRNEDVVRTYQEFINDLVSAQSCHTRLVIDQLVKLFLSTEESNWENGELDEFSVTQFNNIHFILQSILKTLPMSESLLMDLIKHNFPYINAPAHIQMSYVYNLLKIIQYQSDLRIDILQVIIDKVTMLDVQSPREEILQYEENPNEMEVSDIDKCDPVVMRHPTANTLDNVMEIIFRYIKHECYIDGKLNKNRCHRLYNDLLIIFETVILPVHACCHVQYIMYYICSFDTTLALDFLKFLWRQVITPGVIPIIRHKSVAYLSSFLARADFLSLGHLKNYICKLTEWIHDYLGGNDSACNFQSEYKQHTVFYSVCQALFYLIEFRHQDLVNSAIKLKFLQSLNLQKLVSCKLNPLKFCLATIVEKFAAFTRAYQLAYCYSIIENNARASIPVMGNDGQLIVNPVVEMYFPFEACLLPRIKKFIHPIFREYTPVINDETTGLSKPKERLYSGTEDEDDFIGEENLEEHNSSEEPMQTENY